MPTRRSKHTKSHTSSPQTAAALSSKLSLHGKIIRPTPSDGNCLFSGIATSLNFLQVSDNTSEDVRERICDELLKNRAAYECFFCPKDENEEIGYEDFEDVQDADYDAYVARMRKDGEWGGQIECLAASVVYRRTLATWVCDARLDVTVQKIGGRKGREIEVAFDGIAHYVAVVPCSWSRGGSSSDEESAGSTDDERPQPARPATPTPPEKTNNCHCGSGKIYKRCCMKADSAREKARKRVQKKADKELKEQREREEKEEELEQEEEGGSTDDELHTRIERINL